jgi:para-nitrobenzyl esterase
MPTVRSSFTLRSHNRRCCGYGADADCARRTQPGQLGVEVRSRSIFGAIVLVVALLSVPPIASAQPVVTVTGGAITGFVNDGIDQYLGVPYASAGRFRSPEPAPAWPGVRPAVAHSKQCPQALPLPVPVDPDLPSLVGMPANSEDCLSMDLYVPKNAAGRNLPVMVYLYGGAFVLGSNFQYDSPSEMVRNGDVIVAIPNYRVGSLGFLALPELAAEAGGATGTYGTQDQQFALRWVKENIAAFGGNPGNVTIFGESAGGMSVCTQLASPTSKGLFTKAIVESGACARSPLVPPTKDVAYARAAKYALEMGCTDERTRLACLRALPVNRLLDSPTNKFDSPLATWTPIVDGVVLDSTPEEALKAGAASGIPMIVGSNTDEGGTFLVLFDYLSGRIPTAASVTDDVRKLYPDRADQVLARYPVYKYPSPAAALSAVWTDSLFACPALVTTEAATSGGSDVWQYQFADAPVGKGSPILPGAFHAAEVPYIFSRLGGIPIPWTGPAAALAIQLKTTWATFAHTGNPNSSTLPNWDVWSDREQALRIDRTASVMTGTFANEHKCSFWVG